MEGQWKNDRTEGHGLFQWPNGLRWEGKFSGDEGVGRGIYKDRN